MQRRRAPLAVSARGDSPNQLVVVAYAHGSAGVALTPEAAGWERFEISVMMQNDANNQRESRHHLIIYRINIHNACSRRENLNGIDIKHAPVISDGKNMKVMSALEGTIARR